MGYEHRMKADKRALIPRVAVRGATLFAACVAMALPASGQARDGGADASRDGGGVLPVEDLRAAIAALESSSQAARDTAAPRPRSPLELAL